MLTALEALAIAVALSSAPANDSTLMDHLEESSRVADAETRTVTFDDADELMAELPSTSVEHLVVRRRGRRVSLIQVRDTFVPELLKSVSKM